MRLMTSADVAMADEYGSTLQALKERVRGARQRAHRAVNTELINLYWHLGHEILVRRERQGWGAGVMKRLAEDLRAEFPDMTGLSRSNLQYMRAFAAAWDEEAIVQQAVGQLPWGHVVTLLDKLDGRDARDWYAAAAVEYG